MIAPKHTECVRGWKVYEKKKYRREREGDRTVEDKDRTIEDRDRTVESREQVDQMVDKGGRPG